MTRSATFKRKTRETDISVEIRLDGSGEYDINTGIGFLDHMLKQLSRHSMIDMRIKAKGDSHIDAHHTSEDVGIVLGQVIDKALGDRKGIQRFASMDMVMDEVLTKAVIDVSGRPYLVWQVKFPCDRVGNYDTELFREFFHALTSNAKITLHIINQYGINSHHIAESCFKAAARALRYAIEMDPGMAGKIPSTKGTL